MKRGHVYVHIPLTKAKIKICYLKWYGHLHKRPEIASVRHIEELHVQGSRKRGDTNKDLKWSYEERHDSL